MLYYREGDDVVCSGPNTIPTWPANMWSEVSSLARTAARRCAARPFPPKEPLVSKALETIVTQSDAVNPSPRALPHPTAQLSTTVKPLDPGAELSYPYPTLDPGAELSYPCPTLDPGAELSYPYPTLDPGTELSYPYPTFPSTTPLPYGEPESATPGVTQIALFCQERSHADSSGGSQMAVMTRF